MGKPVIFLQQKLKPEHIERITSVAQGHTVIDASQGAWQDTDLNKEDIEIMLGWNAALGKELLELPDSKLSWVQSISAGVDSYDLQAFADRGILLSNASGIHTTSIAEHVLGVLLVESRGIRNAITNRSWEAKKSTSYKQLSQQSMLIVGTGQIGQQLAAFAKGLKINVYGINSTGHPTEGFLECYSQKNMSRIVKDMDIVVNILPLTDETLYLYDEEMFGSMKKGTLFVNVGRGPSVKTDALIAALQNGQLAYAALDVFEEEPLPEDHPLWRMDNVLVTPHISGITPKFKQKLTDIFVANLESFIETGELAKNQIDLTRGY